MKSNLFLPTHPTPHKHLPCDRKGKDLLRLRDTTHPKMIIMLIMVIMMIMMIMVMMMIMLVLLGRAGLEVLV